MTVFIDFETHSAADLKKVGLHNYARNPTTDVWCLCHATDDGEVLTWRPGDPIPTFAYGEDEIVAHNAPFEAAIWRHVLTKRYGWPALNPRRLTCTMARAYAMALPGSLEGALGALGTGAKKDKVGHALMLRMCRPRSVADDGTITWWTDPEKIERLIAYCKTDVVGERALYKLLFPLGDTEQDLWHLDYTINQRGVRIDRRAVEAAIKGVKAAKKALDKEMARVTGGAVQSCSALAALTDWIVANGVSVAGLAKADVVSLLDGELPDAVRCALILRQEAGKASTAKLAVMLLIACDTDDRMRNLFQYFGAATGRWAGRKVQPHNFPRNVPKNVVVEKILALLIAGEYDAVDVIYGAVMDVVSKVLRGFLIPARGFRFLHADYASVEGRGVAWFAGEDWKIKAFEAADAGTGPGIYELSYAKAFGVPVESVEDPSFERQIGKVMELAFGYQGGKGAFRTMARTYGVTGVSDSKADEFKVAWRAQHPATKAVWRALEDAAILAVRNPGKPYKAGHPDRAVTYKMVGTFLWCLLPSGRALCYAFPKILPGEYGPQLTYMTVPSTNDVQRGNIIDDPANTPKWARVATYGGSLLENVIQAICRDLLAWAMTQLEAAGIEVVLHVHDEIVAEVLATLAEEKRAVMDRIMNSGPSWAKGFPVKSKCTVMTRYGKG